MMSISPRAQATAILCPSQDFSLSTTEESGGSALEKFGLQRPEAPLHRALPLGLLVLIEEDVLPGRRREPIPAPYLGLYYPTFLI